MAFGRGSRIPDLHPDCEAFAPLIGTWRGTGHGSYPDIEPFDYEVEWTFTTHGTRWVALHCRTWHTDTGAPWHYESGFLRPVPPDRLECVIAQPGGLGEVQEGTVDGGLFQLRSVAVAQTTTAKRVDVIERTWRVDHDSLRCSVRMAAVGKELGGHLEERLERER
jgi:hypothetical protein